MKVESKRGPGWHLACAILLLCAFAFLTNRARDENHWSCWEFGDVQTMLTLKHWNERGWLANKLLFIPQGYAKAIVLLDEPGFRQHAHGICPVSSPLVGPRLWYTHYPSGYLVPFALFYKIGFTGKFPLQVLSILLSVLAVGLFYLLVCRLASPPVAFFSAVFYLVSPFFHFYADSLANQPLDDLLRFGFMLAVVMSTRDRQEGRIRYWNLLAWLAQFCLSLSSLDSVFFIYVWLVGWDLIEGKGFRWKRWLVFALAPLLAHGLQFVQNVWYLGYGDALKDALGTYKSKSIASAGMFARLGKVAGTLGDITTALFGNASALLIAMMMLLFHYLTLRDVSDRRFPSFQIVLLIAAAGLPYIVLLPAAAKMTYVPRQLLPFAALVTAILSWRLVEILGGLVRHGPGSAGSPSGSLDPTELAGRDAGAPSASPGRAFDLLFVLLAIAFIAFVSMTKGFPPVEELRKFHKENSRDIALARELSGKLPVDRDVIIFNLAGFQMYLDAFYVDGYPQIHPLLEYMSGHPILCFNKPDGLAKDLQGLVARSQGSFDPVIATHNDHSLQAILDALGQAGVIDRSKVRRIPMSECAFADLADAVVPGSSKGSQ